MKGLIKTAAAALHLGKAARPDFPHTERDLAGSLGLAQDSLARARATHQLRRGVDWDIQKNLVCYSAAGRAALLRALGVADSAANAAPLEVVETGQERAEEAARDAMGAALAKDVNDRIVALVTGPKRAEPATGEPLTADLQALYDEQQRLTLAAGKNSDAERAAARAVGAVASFRVVRLVHNRRVLEARPAADEAGDRVWVRVKDSTNFVAGMELEARWTIEGKWQHVGRCPRQKGKW